MAITAAQIDGVAATCAQLQTALEALAFYVSQAQALYDASWTTTVNGVQITLTAPQQAAVISNYATLKANLAAIYAQLP